MAVPVNKDFGREFRRLRQNAGISIREVARRASMSSSYLSAVEGGKVPAPELEAIGRISVALGADWTEGQTLEMLSGRPWPDVLEAVRSHPLEWGTIIRLVNLLEDDDLVELVRFVEGLVGTREVRPNVGDQEARIADETLALFHELRGERKPARKRYQGD